MTKPLRLLKLRPHGMFSNVNEVVQQIHLALQGDYEFAIDWSKSPYRDSGLAEDPWKYYFQSPFGRESEAAKRLTNLPTGTGVLCQPNCVITPSAYPGNCSTLQFPYNLGPAHDIVSRFIRLNTATLAHIDRVAGELLARPTIGLHIRGPHGVAGGSGRFREALGGRTRVPYANYVEAARKALDATGADRVLVCSDSSDCVEAIRDTFGSQAVTTDAARTETGEMHVKGRLPDGFSHSKFAIGLDIVTEAFLLGRCAGLVHGRSNVTFFVRALNPDMPAIFAYEPGLPIRCGASDTGTPADGSLAAFDPWHAGVAAKSGDD